jgi:microcystin-dependent protein
MSLVFSNNAVVLLVSELSSVSSSFVLSSGDGDLFPSVSGGDTAKLTIQDRRTGAIEIMDLVNRVGDSLTVVRGREGTTAQTWPAGSLLSHRVTAETLSAFLQDTDAADAAIASLQSRVDVLETQVNTGIMLIEQHKIPIGGIYISADAVNPGSSTRLNYGTWIAFAAGRCLVGVGTAGGLSWNTLETNSTDAHERTISEANLPSHNHAVDPPATTATTVAGGEHTHSLNRASAIGGNGGNSQKFNIQASTLQSFDTTGASGEHTHEVTVDIPQFNSASTGGGVPINITQPSIGVYMWRRTA